MEPIHALLQQRYSPRAFDERSVSKETIATLIEAVRWSPSSYNEQPWRFIIVAKDDPAEFDKLLNCLVPRNQDWAKGAPVLILSVASLAFARNDKPNRHAYYDVGLAVSQLVLQATALGLSAHQMAGFDVPKSRQTYAIPENFDPVAAIAIGYSAEEPSASRNRRPRDDIAFGGTWGEAY
jgi:nitroreductase